MRSILKLALLKLALIPGLALGLNPGLSGGMVAPARAGEIDRAGEIEMWVLAGNNDEAFFDAAVRAFETAHPGTTVRLEYFPGEAYKTQIQVALAGSEAPDVFFNWAGEDAGRLVRAGLALDITGLAESAGGFKSRIGDAWLSAFTYDGRLYGVPVEAVSKYFYYNRSFFARHGLSIPATLDELLGLCRQIRAIDSRIVPWPLGNAERWKLNHVITMLNERVLGQAATAADYALDADPDVLFTHPGYVQAWQHVVDMREAGCFQDAPNATSPQASHAMFAAEVSPMIYCGTWCAGAFEDDGFTDYGLFRFPGIEGGAGDPGAVFLVPQGYMVAAGTEVPAAAVAWIRFLTNDANAARYAAIKGGIPSNPALIDTVESTWQYKWIVNDIAAATGAVNVLDVLLEASVANAWLDAGVEVLGGTMTPAEAMATIRTVALEAQRGQ